MKYFILTTKKKEIKLLLMYLLSNNLIPTLWKWRYFDFLEDVKGENINTRYYNDTWSKSFL